MGRKRTNKVEDRNVKFISIPRRNMVVYNLDLTEPDEEDQIVLFTGDEIKQCKDALVKLRVKYKRGDDNLVDDYVKSFLKTMDGVAKYVYQPEYIIVGDRKVKSEEFSNDLSIESLVDLWFDLYKPVFDKDEILGIVNENLDGVDIGFSKPNPIVVLNHQIKNYMPFKFVDLDFSETNQSYIIKGANWSGKSSLVESLLFGIYGKGRELRLDSDYINNNEDEMESKIVLMNTSNGSKMEIVRKMTRKSGSSIFIDGSKYKKKESKEYIDKFMGVDFTDFLNTQFVRQGDLLGILNSGGVTLQRHLMRWNNISFWSEVESNISKKINSLSEEMRMLINKEEELFENASLDVWSDNKLEKQKKKLDDMKTSVFDKNEVKSAYADLKLFMELKEVVDNISPKEELEKNDRKLNSSFSKLEKKLDDLKLKRHEYDVEIEKKKRYISGFDGVCPIDNCDCPRTVEIVNNDDDIRDCLDEIENNRKKVVSQIKKLSNKMVSIEDDLDGVRNSLDTIDNFEKMGERFSDNHEERMKKLEGLMKNIEENNYDEDDIFYLENLIECEIVRRNKKQEAIDLKASVVKKKRKQIDYLGKLRFAKLICGKTGIPFLQLENSVKLIESQTNKILETMGVDLRLEFSFENELTRKSDYCYSCGFVYKDKKQKDCVCGEKRGRAKSDEISINTRVGNKLISFEQNSTGGKSIISLAVRVAMIRMLGLKMLISDEVCASLDDRNVDLLINMLNVFFDFGIDQIMMISHRSNILDSNTNVINVVRDLSENYSTLSISNG